MEIEETNELGTGEVVEEQKPAEGSEETPEGVEEAPEGAEATEGVEEPVPPKRPGGYQRKIERLEREKAALEREKAYLEGLARGAAGAGTQPASNASQGPPKEEQFEKWEDYVRASAVYDARLAAREENNRLRSEQEVGRISGDFQARAAAFSTKVADYHEVLDDVSGILVPAHLNEMLYRSERGPELMYALAKDPSRLVRMAKMSPMDCAVELGRLEGSLAPGKTKTTTAPKPVAPVSTKGGTTTSKSPDDMTMAEFKAWRARKK